MRLGFSAASQRWIVAATVLLLVAGGSWKFAQKTRAGAEPSPSAADAAAVELVDAHIRALQPGHLTDVTSTDQHTVKPWFDGKIAFAPPVSDFGAQDFPLIGGRLDVFQGRTSPLRSTAAASISSVFLFGPM